MKIHKAKKRKGSIVMLKLGMSFIQRGLTEIGSRETLLFQKYEMFRENI